jgi:uncharacterized protein (TIGR02147 family)
MNMGLGEGKDIANIFEYDNYRHYLRDIYTKMKAKDRKFSFRYFSRLVGCTSTNFFKLVTDGERNLSAESIEKFSKGLKHNKEEAFFFKNLVMLNQATTTADRQFYAEQLFKSRSYKKIQPLKESQFHYYAF